jgi:N-methylhydantoinase B
VPVFHDGQLVAFAASTAHHLDIGALSPGSCGIVDAIDAYAEGLQFKAIKGYDRGVRSDAVWQLLRDNIRVSALVVGDMEAQIAAARIGAEQLVALIERYGYQCFTAACSAVMHYAERLMRQAIAALPGGDYAPHNDRRICRQPGPAETTFADCRHCAGCAATKSRSDRRCRQIANRPINMPFEGTVTSRCG